MVRIKRNNRGEEERIDIANKERLFLDQFERETLSRN